MKARVELIGGPLDGYGGWKTLVDQPGKFPLYVHCTRGKKYVYQGRRFLGEDEAAGPLVMDFVQIIDQKDDV